MKRIFITVSLLFSYGMIYTQVTHWDTISLKNLPLLKEGIHLYSIQPDFPITSLTCKIKPGDSFEGTYIIAGADTIIPLLDEERGEENGYVSSELIIFAEKISEFMFQADNINDTIIFFYINASMPEEDNPEVKLKLKKKENGGCSEPAMIDQEEWRTGLPAPDYVRQVHEVKNIIVHHSAGQILSDDYYVVVRSIYLFHTEDRGWSDIGYNYLIAHDGSLFKGRDPAEYEQDNVKGAHFCASNTGTMGVCIIGTYTDVEPSGEALTSLVSLLNWKIANDDLHPLQTNWHALNPNLPVIAGHRDGCATECPGQALYDMLPLIREEVYDNVQHCAEWNTANIEVSNIHNISVYISPNPVKNVLMVHSDKIIEVIKIIDMMGRPYKIIPSIYTQHTYSLHIEILPPGIYILLLRIDKELIRKEFIVY